MPQPWAQAYSKLLQFTPRGTNVATAAGVDDPVAVDDRVRGAGLDAGLPVATGSRIWAYNAPPDSSTMTAASGTIQRA